jgi:NAD(P)-dependent dehydrogenase (short-subunit alcohol dehydrogenase family)
VTKAGIAALARELADEWEHRPNLRVNAIVPGPIRSPMRSQTHPGEDPSQLPTPDALVPLYLHLVAGQPKSESDALIDAHAWLAGEPCATSLRP